MKKYIILILIIFFVSCKATKNQYQDKNLANENIKNIYNNNSLDETNNYVNYVLKMFKAEKSNKSIIHFTNGFKGDTIELLNDKKTLFKRSLKTTPDLGFAYAQTIDNEKEVKIIILNKNDTNIPLNQNDLKKHKFIYISKKTDNLYIIEYSNLPKKFL